MFIRTRTGLNHFLNKYKSVIGVIIATISIIIMLSPNIILAVIGVVWFIIGVNMIIEIKSNAEEKIFNSLQENMSRPLCELKTEEISVLKTYWSWVQQKQEICDQPLNVWFTPLAPLEQKHNSAVLRVNPLFDYKLFGVDNYDPKETINEIKQTVAKDRESIARRIFTPKAKRILTPTVSEDGTVDIRKPVQISGIPSGTITPKEEQKIFARLQNNKHISLVALIDDERDVIKRYWMLVQLRVAYPSKQNNHEAIWHPVIISFDQAKPSDVYRLDPIVKWTEEGISLLGNDKLFGRQPSSGRHAVMLLPDGTIRDSWSSSYGGMLPQIVDIDEFKDGYAIINGHVIEAKVKLK